MNFKRDIFELNEKLNKKQKEYDILKKNVKTTRIQELEVIQYFLK